MAGRRIIIFMILEYYSTMDDKYHLTKEELLTFNDDKLIVEIGFCTMFR